MNGTITSFITDGAVIIDGSQLDTESLDYKTWAILAINILLLLERAFKTTKFALRCNKNGCYCGTRTPPVSPGVSHDNKETPSSTDEKVDIKEAIRALERARESIEEASRSYKRSTRDSVPVDESSEYDEFMDWKKKRKRRGSANKNSADHE